MGSGGGGVVLHEAEPATVPSALDRPSTAQRVADLLRERIVDGQLLPGAQFAEQQLTTQLGVSRNTLREAFQILVAEHLLVHVPHHGVFVRRLDASDVRDIYACRRLVECAALADPADTGALVGMRAAVHNGRAAARARDWRAVGTADVRFHLAVTALAGSERMDRTVRALFAELRLVFGLVPDARALHRPFLLRNAEILRLVEEQDQPAAARAMRSYLDDAEAMVLAALGQD